MIERLAERSPLCALLGPSVPRPRLRTKPGSTPPATTCSSSPSVVGHSPANLTAGLQSPYPGIPLLWNPLTKVLLPLLRSSSLSSPEAWPLCVCLSPRHPAKILLLFVKSFIQDFVCRVFTHVFTQRVHNIKSSRKIYIAQLERSWTKEKMAVNCLNSLSLHPPKGINFRSAFCFILWMSPVFPWWLRGREPACQGEEETEVPSQGQEDPLGEGNGKPLQHGKSGKPTPAWQIW